MRNNVPHCCPLNNFFRTRLVEIAISSEIDLNTTMHQSTFTSIFLLIFCCLLSSCESRTGEVEFSYVNPLQKILPEQNLFMPCPAEVHTARGECATFQFVVRSPQAIRSLKIHVDDFMDSATHKKVRLDSLKSYFVGYVHEGRKQVYPGNDFLVSASDFYPDPLLDDPQRDVQPNVNQAVWVSCPVPRNIRPGTYSSRVTITGRTQDGTFKRSLPIKLKIYPACIDRQNLMVANWFQTSFRYVDGPNPVAAFSPRWWELMGEMADLMRDHGQNVVKISPLLLTRYSFDARGCVNGVDFTNFDRVAELFIRKGVLKRLAGGDIAKRMDGWDSPFGYVIPHITAKDTSFVCVSRNDPKARNFYRFFFKALDKHLSEKGWQEIYMQHIADEPNDTTAQSYLEIASFVKAQMPHCKIIDACLTDRLDNRLDIWVPQLNRIKEALPFYRQQQQQGKEVWFYTCVWPQADFANRFIRQPLLKTRLLHWINYRFGITGYLHWGFNYWQGEDPMTETASIQPSGTVLPAGDAWIIYPYKNHLIPSIRLAAMRDGINDYELLRQLGQKDSVTARQIAESMVFNFQMYDTDIAHFRKTRIKLLEALSEQAGETNAPATSNLPAQTD